ncbi:hypothetical protein JB92DRAFT_2911128 [Gautieria morchelliformis]|nr:hypothetical protein JB92DRAFT_2911128 [Gautieria morchelliformis]
MTGDDEEERARFNERQKDHYVKLLREKWGCPVEGHTVCVPTRDGQHFRLAGVDIDQWVNALCVGEATTADPPHSMFERIRGSAVWNRTTGKWRVQAVSISNSRSKTDNTSISSGVPGPGWLAGKAMKWLGVKSLNALEFAAIKRRANGHISCLKKWGKGRPSLGENEQTKVLGMLDDALQMSRCCYPTTVNNSGYSIGRAVYRWLRVYEDFDKSPEMTSWLVKVQVSLIPILLSRVSRVDPLADDLAYETLSTLIRAPLAVQGMETAMDIIRLVARELAYAKCTFQHSWLGVWLLRIVDESLRVRTLSADELNAIRELAVRRAVQHTEYNSKDLWRPWEIALFAQCASQDQSFKDVVVGPHGLPSLIVALDSMLMDEGMVRGVGVHWENVALTLRALAFLSEQEWVAQAVDAAIVRSLLGVFRPIIPQRWFCTRFWAADALRNMVAHRPELARTLLQEDAVSAFATLTNPEIVRHLSANPQLDRRQSQHNPPNPPLPTAPPSLASPISDFSSPVTDSPLSPTFPQLSPMDRHRHSSSTTSEYPITPTGVGERGISSIPTLRPPSFQQHADGLRDHDHPSSATTPNLSRAPSQDRHLEDYKVAATKRAAELSVYIRQWTEWTPDKLPMLDVPRLEAVGAGVGWLSGFDPAGWASDQSDVEE